MTRKLSLMLGFLICSRLNFCSADDFQLRFPHDRNCGTVSIGLQPVSSNGNTDFYGLRRSLGMAQGLLTVPTGSFVELEINKFGAADLSFLMELPTDSIHFLKISGARLAEADFESLARFTSLRAMLLTNCKTTSNLDLSKTPVPRELQLLNFSMSDAESRKFIQGWAAKCARLEYLYDREGAFDLDAIRYFKNHPTINFLTVDFDEDAVEKIQALSLIPHLRSLNVTVKSTDYLVALPQLRNIELFNWGDGRIDAEVLKTLGKLPYLRTIRFQGNAEIAPDFAQGLKYLNTVEELGLNIIKTDCPKDELQAALVSMTNLTRMPILTNPSKQILDLICERGKAESVEIDGLGPDATTEQIVRLCQLKNLESFKLRGIPFTKEIGEALSQCPNLSFLAIDVSEFDGNALTRPESFGNLTNLHLYIINNVADEPAVNLMPLARLPKLRELTLWCDSLQPIDYRFIAECPLLTNFSTNMSVVNDQVIEQIAPSKSLESLALHGNCVVTDLGLKRLARCHQLKSLAIGGIFSVDGICQLDQIRGLNSLIVESLLSEEERGALSEHFASLSSAQFPEWRSNYGKLQIRNDGFWRDRGFDETEKADAVEGRTLKSIMGSALSVELEKKLRGKVVLVDFWGVWCGPCIELTPHLERLRKRFGADRFEVLGIHTKEELDGMKEFLMKYPKPWPNVADETGELTKSFAVPHYPGLYLVDRHGKIRVAMPHRLGLEVDIQKLLDEK